MLLTEFSFSPAQITSSGVQPQEMSLDLLCQSKVLSRHISAKQKKSALTYQHLNISYKRNGYDGLYFLLSETNESGKIRITKSNNVIQKIFNHFQNVCLHKDDVENL